MPYCQLVKTDDAPSANDSAGIATPPRSSRRPKRRAVFLPGVPRVGDLIVVDRCYVVEAILPSAEPAPPASQAADADVIRLERQLMLRVRRA